MTKEDNQLIQGILKGDKASFKSLVLKYQDMMFSVCMSVLKNKTEAEEATQDTFVKVYNKLKDYNESAKLSSWMYRIAYRTSLDYIRKRKLTSDIDAVDQNLITAEINSSLENEDLSKMLLAALDQLPNDESLVLRLFYLDEMSVKEVEEVTGLSHSNIKVKLFRARKKLGEHIKKDYKELSDLIHN